MPTSKPTELRGVTPVLPTPFREDESIDFDALSACVEFAIDRELPGICLPAYGGEFYKLSEAERLQLVETAVSTAAGRIAVVAQSNHPSTRGAAALAKQHQDMGADLISVAIPRQFRLPEASILDYCRTVCEAVSIPVLIQDFNPGGATVGGDFARQLADACENFRYLKLEEPLMSPKVDAIRRATEDRIGVLEGWGGMYLLDLIPSGICGLIPGLGPADLLQRVWTLGTSDRFDEALDLFQIVLPQLVFSLQNMELFLHIDKQLLAARGVLPESSTYVRRPSWTPTSDDWEHGRRLNQRIVDAGRKQAD